MRTTTVRGTDVRTALASYAERFHEGIGRGHHVASPLGAWMLLALCGPASDGRLRDEITAALGIDVDTAAAFVATLLAEPHPAVASAAAIWTRPGLPAAGMSYWLARLPSMIERGDVPAQDALDAWASEHTYGMIDRFPLTLHPETFIVLATALATKVSWETPFEAVSSDQLSRPGEQPWSARVRRVLRSPMSEASHTQFIATSDRAGDVAVHTVQASPGLSVTSVIARPDVPPVDVIAAAYELAIAIARGRDVPARSLFDLPVGDSPMWSIEEEATWVPSPDGRFEECSAVLPAWSADAQHDLGRPELGFPAAAAALVRLAGTSNVDFKAAQSVVARYDRKGFEAAALTALMAPTLAGGPSGQHGRLRIGTLRFGHPFAVVAVTTENSPWDRPIGATAMGPWHGLPVYSAWVAEPTEVSLG